MELTNNINVFNADCLEEMRNIPDKSVDLILCDLPYGTTSCPWDEVIPFDALWLEYKRIIKGGKPIVLFGTEPFSSKLRLSNLDMYAYDWVWNKKNTGSPTLAHIQPLRVNELISVFYERKKPNNRGYFMNLREYMFNERKKTGLTNKKLQELLQNTMTSHYFTWGEQFAIPSEDCWVKLQKTGFFNRSYESIKEEYKIEEERRQKDLYGDIGFNVYNPQGLVLYNKAQSSNIPAIMREGEKDTNHTTYIQQYTNYPKSIIDFTIDKNNIHPTQKPVALLEYLIKTYTNDGGLVLDNCMGGGSTGVACIRTGRGFIGIEKEEKYFKAAVDRLKIEIEKIEK